MHALSSLSYGCLSSTFLFIALSTPHPTTVHLITPVVMDMFAYVF